jgi:hypothetical protein
MLLYTSDPTPAYTCGVENDILYSKIILHAVSKGSPLVRLVENIAKVSRPRKTLILSVYGSVSVSMCVCVPRGLEVEVIVGWECVCVCARVYTIIKRT